MVPMKFTRGALFAGVLTAAAALSQAPQAPGQGVAEVRERGRLSAAETEKLHQFLRPQPGESRWMELDWYPNVWEARQKAAAEGKPLFLWAGSGGAPAAGC
ncbi:MAG: hypothetical protein WD069_21865 [Planctomycetales bacterium]